MAIMSVSVNFIYINNNDNLLCIKETYIITFAVPRFHIIISESKNHLNLKQYDGVVLYELYAVGSGRLVKHGSDIFG